MPAIAVRMAVNSRLAGGVGLVTGKEEMWVGLIVGKEGVWGVFSSGDGVWAHLGIESGSAMFVGTISGTVVGMGAGEGANNRQIGVVGVESASISMSVNVLEASLPGGGVVRLRTLTFFFLVLLGRAMLSEEGFIALGVWMVRFNGRALLSFRASWMVVLCLFLSYWRLSAALALNSASKVVSLALVSSSSACFLMVRYASASLLSLASSSAVLV